MGKKIAIFGLCMCMITILTLSPTAKSETNKPVSGGTIKFALQGDPATLDGHISTSNIVNTVTQHIYEGLVAFDRESVPQPMLAESYEIRNNNLTYVFHLRKNIRFHNGQEMRSEDVIASLNRWMKVSSLGGQVGKKVEGLEAPDDYTVVLKLSEPYSELPTFLALLNSGAVVMPKSVVDAAGENPVQEYIGTGPYYLEKWDLGNYVLLKRFEQYKSRSEKPSKKAGARIAYADAIRFVAIPEASTRLAGVKSGEYDVAMSVSYDLYESLKMDAEIEVVLVEGMNAPVFFFNHKEGIMKNKDMRHAVLAALDMGKILKGTAGNESLFSLGPNFSFEKDSIWFSDAGKTYYNQANPEKARDFLKKAGYNNEPIRWIAPTGYPEIYWSTAVAVQQLIEAGFNIDLRIFDSATYFSKTRPDPTQWDIFSTYHGWVASLSQWTVLRPTYPGWWENKEKDRLLNHLMAQSDIKKRAEVWGEIQQLIWEEAAVCRLGTLQGLIVISKRLKGFEGMLQPKLWNSWIEQ